MAIKYGDTNLTLGGRLGIYGGNQYIDGTSSNNTLYGDAHKMVMNARGGMDTIYAGAGNDSVFGNAYEMHNSAWGGGDYLDGGVGNDYMVGDAMFMYGSTRGGGDVIHGGADGDFVYGDAYLLSENARGGNDYVYGDAGADTLIGDSYLLWDNAVGGNDTMLENPCDIDNDLMYGDAWTITGSAAGGNDIMAGGGGADTMYGDAYTLDNNATGGADNLDGGNGSDTLYGDAMNLFGASQGGDDYVFGNGNDDVVYGDAFNIAATAHGGNDTVLGGGGNDALFGDGSDCSGASGGNDLLHGGAGNDVLYGDNFPTETFFWQGHSAAGGNDILIGGIGNDQLWGNGGNDTFKFAQFDGNDVILDFTQTGAEQDLIDLSDYNYNSFNDLQITSNPLTGWAVIQLSPEDSIMVAGVVASRVVGGGFPPVKRCCFVRGGLNKMSVPDAVRGGSPRTRTNLSARANVRYGSEADILRRGSHVRFTRNVGRGETDDAWYSRRLLRACRERPNYRSAQKRDELASSHVTSLEGSPAASGCPVSDANEFEVRSGSMADIGGRPGLGPLCLR